MTAKELKEQARFGEGMRSRRKGYKFYDDEFQTFCETLCREIDEFEFDTTELTKPEQIQIRMLMSTGKVKITAKMPDL